MTVNVPENKAETPNIQEKVDTNLNQQNVDTNLAQQQQTEVKEPEQQEDPNWRAFREARKRDRAEKEAAERRAAEKEAEATALKAAMEAAFARTSPIASQQQYYAEQPEESDEDRIKRLVAQEIAARDAAAEQLRAQREQQEYPQRLVQSYPDFNHIISQENLDYLDYHYPEVSRPLQRLKDGFDKWSRFSCGGR